MSSRPFSGLPFHLRLLAACLALSGVAFAKPVIQISGGAPGDGFVVADYSYSVPPSSSDGKGGAGGEILLSLSDADAARLAALTKAKLGERIVVSIGGTEVAMPVVRDVIAGKDLKLSFPDAQTFKAVEAALAK
jgi:hypothetical protein